MKVEWRSLFFFKTGFFYRQKILRYIHFFSSLIKKSILFIFLFQTFYKCFQSVSVFFGFVAFKVNFYKYYSSSFFVPYEYYSNSRLVTSSGQTFAGEFSDFVCFIFFFAEPFNWKKSRRRNIYFVKSFYAEFFECLKIFCQSS